MDIATIVGFVVGMVLIVYGIISGGGNLEFIDPPGIAIVGGGAICATMITVSMKRFLTVFSVLKKAFIARKTQSPADLIKTLVGFAEIARRDGILALEEASKNLEDEFMVKGLQLAVDGADPELISEIMRTELEHLQERHKLGRKMFESMAKFGPGFGMVGTLIGLICLLRNLSEPEKVGPAMSMAMITTFYGAVMCNFICGPIAEKLDTRSKEETLLKEIIIQGVMSIQSGDNPRIVEQKLEIFLEPRARGEKRAAPSATVKTSA
jgi:chemotaxis protein MotA